MNQIGVLGLGPMGSAFAANVAGRNCSVHAWDYDNDAGTGLAAETGFLRFPTIAAVVRSLAAPRCIMMLVRSGAVVDEVLGELLPLLQRGDVVVDCGNSHYQDTSRRESEAAAAQIRYMGFGLSGGPAGARSGPAVMAGGSRSAWDEFGPLFESFAARAKNGRPCCAYFGAGGAGHFVKAVHNGIEYGIMQLLLEAYGLLRIACGMDASAAARFFDGQETTPVGGYLATVTAVVLAARDSASGRSLIDLVDPIAEQKGTGRWAVQAALELGISAPMLAEAVMYRDLSSTMPVPEPTGRESSDAAISDGFGVEESLQVKQQLTSALGLAFLAAFEQGLAIISAYLRRSGEDANLRDVVGVWRSGSILQGQTVEYLYAALETTPAAATPVGSGQASGPVRDGIAPLGRVVAAAARAGVPCPGFASALSYVQSVTGTPLPTGLLQLQRDYFGQHGIRQRGSSERLAAPWQANSKR